MDQEPLFSIKEPDVCKNRHGGADTSILADKKVQKTRDRELIYGYIYHAGRFGHTLDELSIMLHRNPNALSGRLTELRMRGKIKIGNQRRLTRAGCSARVYLDINQQEAEGGRHVFGTTETRDRGEGATDSSRDESS